MLAGMCDRFDGTFPELHNKIDGFAVLCQAEFAKVTKRMEDDTQSAHDVGQDKLLHIREKAGLVAELSILETKEREAQDSFDSTVQRRAMNHQTFLDWMDVTGKQLNVISEALGGLTKMRDEMQLISQGSVSEVNQVIGVFMQMQSSVSADIADETAKQPTADSEFANLVKSYQNALQDIETQYASKGARKVAADASVLKSQRELALRNELASDESTIRSALQGLCGSPSAKFAVVLAESDRRQQALHDSFQSALSLLRDMDFYGSGNDEGVKGSSVLLARHKRVQRPQPGLALRHTPTARTSRRNQFGSIASSSAVQREKAGGRASSAALVEDVAVGMRSFASRESAGGSAPTTTLSAVGSQCVQAKQTLVQSLIEARQASRFARADFNAQRANDTSIEELIALTKSKRQEVDSTRSGLDLATLSAFAIDIFLHDVHVALNQMNEVVSNVSAYSADAAASPLALSLKVAVDHAQVALEHVEQFVSGSPGDEQTMASLVSDHFSFENVLGQARTHIQQRVASLEQEQTAGIGRLQSLEAAVQAEEGKVANLQTDLQLADSTCETNFYSTAPALDTNTSLSFAAVGAIRQIRGVPTDEVVAAWAAARRLLGGSASPRRSS
eukprot:TRINITY_DN54764_c0_g1_i1.p1 TRINITY_DN54764_c0_g1~~TRINITY_DN54764_c0_g1_i1.p1  ORF type:complete len:706 (+),score=132.30 TRINITY_DN54764_c0_g1_i1:264-2120(+)